MKVPPIIPDHIPYTKIRFDQHLILLHIIEVGQKLQGNL